MTGRRQCRTGPLAHCFPKGRPRTGTRSRLPNAYSAGQRLSSKGYQRLSQRIDRPGQVCRVHGRLFGLRQTGCRRPSLGRFPFFALSPRMRGHARRHGKQGKRFLFGLLATAGTGLAPGRCRPGLSRCAAGRGRKGGLPLDSGRIRNVLSQRSRRRILPQRSRRSGNRGRRIKSPLRGGTFRWSGTGLKGDNRPTRHRPTDFLPPLPFRLPGAIRLPRSTHRRLLLIPHGRLPLIPRRRLPRHHHRRLPLNGYRTTDFPFPGPGAHHHQHK